MTRTILFILAVTTVLAAPVSAQPAAEHASIKVFYGDLDLSKAAGMQTLRGRLKAASLQVCGNSRGALRIGTIQPAQCTQDAIANALEAIAKAQNRRVVDNHLKSAD